MPIDDESLRSGRVSPTGFILSTAATSTVLAVASRVRGSRIQDARSWTSVELAGKAKPPQELSDRLAGADKAKKERNDPGVIFHNLNNRDQTLHITQQDLRSDVRPAAAHSELIS
ncbi:hypothetical protein PCANC_07976 [Puccinia coronata f. sp. avenae]|uniref:Uncharacterized protein n=1 Tax=Puccinia coronata f. sp. avenae TaxID=200324 RepID=A0A2N5SHJ5_9BASI|nr:hypothetical protein PCANC_14435 [Puccinia coronata f. sp. avenae]PLW42825.1 hypothetical protein PCANC_07976 [Puccinia coronata f. sp. avenae]